MSDPPPPTPSRQGFRLRPLDASARLDNGDAAQPEPAFEETAYEEEVHEEPVEERAEEPADDLADQPVGAF